MSTLLGSKDARLRKFISFVVKGESNARAYQLAGYRATTVGSASTQAGRLLKKPEVQAELSRLRELSRQEDVLTLAEKRKFLRNLVTTPVGSVDENHPLCQRVTRIHLPGNVVKVITEVPCKLKALEIDAKLAGELVGGVQADTVSPEGSGDIGTDERVAHVLGLILKHAGGRTVTASRPVDGPVVDVEPVVETPPPSRRLEEVGVALARSMARPKRSLTIR